MASKAVLRILPFAVLVAVVCITCSRRARVEEPADAAPKVDFSHAFATPHRITIGRPDASDRTLLDLQPNDLRMAWTFDNLAMPHYPLSSYKPPTTPWDLRIIPRIDGKPFTQSRWTRLEKVLPGLENVYEDALGTTRFEAVGGITAGLIGVEVVNRDSKPHQFHVFLRCDTGTLTENPAWIDWTRYKGDNIVAGWAERADRVLVLGVGADSYSLQPDGRAPGSRSMILVWDLKPGQRREGWIVHPYQAYVADLPKLRKHDWAKEMAQGKQEWRDLLARATKMDIPDPAVSNAHLACLADLFIMREPAQQGYLGAAPGTELYRSINSAEAAIVAVALDQHGFHKEAADGYRIALDMQEPDGNWADYKGWMHSMWCCSGFKCWMVMEHFRLTGDKQFLAKVYPRMIASSRWQESERARMRPAGDKRPLTYGLMPRGMGDCGLKDDDDMYGIFFPHNIWAVYADRCSLEAAKILGKTKDVEELTKLYETAWTDLMTAIERGVIQEKGYRWIPGTPGKTTGSRWGVLNITSPCGLLPPDHELVTGTLRHIEANMSKGGMPLNTGWMSDGTWVAITLDNVAEAQLARGNGDAAAKYLYATLNHGTPLHTWCEERGADPGTSKCTGDKQHLWTPVAVARLVRDMLVIESGDGLNLASGADRHWLASGKPVGVTDAPTHFGPVSYRMQYDATNSKVTGEATFTPDSTAAWAVLHIRLPNGLRIKSVGAESKATALPDGSGLRWEKPRGVMQFQAVVGK